MIKVAKRSRQRGRRASSLAELVVTTVLVGVLMTAALSSTGQSLLSQRKCGDRVIGRYLSQSLLADIQAKTFKDPDAIVPLLGLDLGETLGLQSSYDDVDDYHGYSESPPKKPDGTPLSGYAGWSRTVEVESLDPVTLAVSTSADTGIKRIKVTAAYNGVTIHSIYGLRTSSP
jgi:hypothetical protein